MMNTHGAWERVAIRRTGLVVLLAGLASLAVALVLTLPQTATAGHSPTADLVAVDTDPTGNTNDTIGAIEANGAAQVGDPVTVDVVIDNVSDLLGFSLDLTFDATILSFTGLDEEFSILSGGVVPGSNPPAPFNPLVVGELGDAPAGLLKIFVAMAAGGTELPGGLDGFLIRLSFDAVGPGTSPLTLSTIDLAAGTGAAPEKFAPTATADGTVVVTSPDVAPTAVDDPGAGAPLSTQPGGFIHIGVLGNDTAGTNTLDVATVTVTQQPPVGQGTAIANIDGTIDYFAPAAGFQGTTTFQYTVDGTGGLTSNAGIVTVNVDGNPPTITPPTDITVVETSLDAGAAQTTEDASGRSIATFLGQATATDPEDGDISANVLATVTGAAPPDPFLVGDTTADFHVSDSAGNPAPIQSAVVSVLAFDVDTDGDGTDNGDEVFNGTDPNDATSCPTDLNGSGGPVDILDVILMINATGAPYDARFDLNRDGTFVDFLDLIVLLNAFDQTCQAAP